MKAVRKWTSCAWSTSVHTIGTFYMGHRRDQCKQYTSVKETPWIEEWKKGVLDGLKNGKKAAQNKDLTLDLLWGLWRVRYFKKLMSWNIDGECRDMFSYDLNMRWRWKDLWIQVPSIFIILITVFILRLILFFRVLIDFPNL